MAGRGTSMTMPAWMKAAGGAAPSGVVPGVSSLPAAPAAQAQPRPALAFSAPTQAAQPRPALAFSAAPSFSAPLSGSQMQGAFGGSAHSGGATMSQQARPAAAMQQAAQQQLQHALGGTRAPVAHVPAAAVAAPTAPAGGVGTWTEHKAPDGRMYYYNATTKVSTYDKPESLKSAAERAIPPCAWTEHKSPDGKPYFYNASKKESVWVEPKELTEHKLRMGTLKAATAPAVVPVVVAAAPAPAPAPAAAALAPVVAGTVPPITLGARPSGMPPMSMPPPLGMGMPPHMGMQMMTPGMYPPGMQPPPHMMGGPPPHMMGMGMPPYMMGVPPPHAGAGMPPPMVAPALTPAPVATATSTAPAPASTGVPAPAAAATAKAGADGSKGGSGGGGGAAAWASLSDEEKVARFKEMLRERNVRAESRWAEILPLIQHDKRFNLLKTQGERKQAFSEYTSARSKEEKEEHRKRSQASRDAFVALLATRRDIVSGFSRYREVEAILGKEAAWNGVSDPTTRMELFNECVGELAKKEKEERRRDAEAKEAAFVALLKARPDIVHVHAKWADVKTLIAGEGAYQALDKVERLRVYKEYILGVEREEEERRRAEMDRERARLKELEGEALAIFTQRFQTGVLTLKSTWSALSADIASGADADSEKLLSLADSLSWTEAAITAIKSSSMGEEAAAHVPNPMASLGKVFALAVEEADRLQRADRRLLRDMIDDAGLGWTLATSVDSHTTFAEWTAKLSAACAAAGDKYPGKYTAAKVPLSSSSSSSGSSAATAVASAAPCGEVEEGIEPRTALEELARVRPWNLSDIFDDALARAVEEEAEAERRVRKQKERYDELLMDYFYRSDHVDTSWEDAKSLLRNRSVFASAPSHLRQVWFDAYMDRLRSKAAARKARLLAERAATLSAGGGGGECTTATAAQPEAEVEEGEEPEPVALPESAPEVLMTSGNGSGGGGDEGQVAGHKRRRSVSPPNGTRDHHHHHRDVSEGEEAMAPAGKRVRGGEEGGRGHHSRSHSSGSATSLGHGARDGHDQGRHHHRDGHHNAHEGARAHRTSRSRSRSERDTRR